MATPSPPRRGWTIGGLHFDPSSGELCPRDGEERATVRLAPQPARLLELLAEKQGALLSREEIQAELWPEVHVDFDQSLNFCIHQVRGALGDTADSPRYIETLPRRGYRLKEPARRLGDESRSGGSKRPRSRWLMAALLALVALAAWWGVQRGGTYAPPRLAVTPFRPPVGITVRGEPSRIAEALLLDLGNLGPEVLAVLGPATTSRYGGSFPELDRMAQELELDYVLNGRFVPPAEGGEHSALLVELIRASDGAHVWVEAYDEVRDPAAVAREILRATRRELDLGNSPVAP